MSVSAVDYSYDPSVKGSVEQISSPDFSNTQTEEYDDPTWGGRTNRAQFANAAKLAGRRNAEKVTDEEHQSFLDERAALVTMQLEGNLTRKDELRLRYVNWTLDRIEDARFGPSLDLLEHSIATYENIKDEVRNFCNELAKSGAVRR